MHKELEERMEKINEFVNEILADSGLDYTVSDIQFTDKTSSVANWQKSEARFGGNVSRVKADAQDFDLELTGASNDAGAAKTEECWKWKCFTTPTGTKCIKIPC